MKDGKFLLKDLRLVILSKVYNLSDFDCGDEDLNDFLKNDSFKYQKSNIAKTYLVIYDEKVIGFFSLCNDAIKLDINEIDYTKLKKKPLPEYPSVKIARLAVDKSCQKRNIGKILIQIAFGLISKKICKLIGCRFITVDSYINRIDFYKRFNFVINEHEKYKNKKRYISMRYDLLNPPNLKKC